MTLATALESTHAPSVQAPAPSPAGRLLPLDWVRGLVIALMSLDHAGDVFDGGRRLTDAAWMWHPGDALPASFFTRWLTHLCAPPVAPAIEKCRRLPA